MTKEECTFEFAKCLHCCFLLLFLGGVRKGGICTSTLVAVLGELFGLPASLPASPLSPPLVVMGSRTEVFLH